MFNMPHLTKGSQLGWGIRYDALYHIYHRQELHNKPMVSYFVSFIIGKRYISNIY